VVVPAEAPLGCVYASLALCRVEIQALIGNQTAREIMITCVRFFL
jgi:hypothetical protein